MHTDENQLSVFPAFFRVAGKVAVVFGEGEEAFAKARLLANTKVEIVVVAEAPEKRFQQFIDTGAARLCSLADADAVMANAVLVFAATGEADTDRAIVDKARALKIPANAVDQPDYCDFFTPALVNRAPVAVAIGTEGAGPVLAQIIRAEIDQLLSPSLGKLVRLATDYRSSVERLFEKGAPRRDFWHRFFRGKIARAVEHGDMAEARREVTLLTLDAAKSPKGYIWLVGAGPGAVDLLTLRAQRVMMQADVIVYDALVPQTVVDMGRRDAIRISVGKRKNCHSKSQNEINDLLVELGKEGKRVVRLKSGDPLIFGRAAEEMAALREADIGYEIVPGITSAFAAAADFELPLTLRGVASSLVFTTGHDMTGDVLPDWARLAVSGATIAVYMGRTVAASVAERLIAGGMPEETTVAVVENASRYDARLFHGTLRDLPDLQHRDELTGPVMVVIGEAVAGANFEKSIPLARQKAQANVLTGA